MSLSPAGVALGLALAPEPSQGPALALVGGLLGPPPAGLLLLVALAAPGRPRPVSYQERSTTPETAAPAGARPAPPVAARGSTPKRSPSRKRDPRRTSTERTDSGGGT